VAGDLGRERLICALAVPRSALAHLVQRRMWSEGPQWSGELCILASPFLLSISPNAFWILSLNTRVRPNSRALGRGTPQTRILQ